MWRFVVSNNQAGKPARWLYSANNEMVAWAGETFASLGNAQSAATAFRAGASSARYEVYTDAAGQYRWRAWRSSDKVAASGEAFSTRAAAEQAADRVRRNAGSATL